MSNWTVNIRSATTTWFTLKLLAQILKDEVFKKADRGFMIINGDCLIEANLPDCDGKSQTSFDLYDNERYQLGFKYNF